MLLKNGHLLSWGENTFSLGRKCKTSGGESSIPKEIEFKIKIIDVACGSEHILVRNIAMEVYSWGKNDFGQVN
jgi:alpha-tubulin suppressor-like RCC1 family protein